MFNTCVLNSPKLRTFCIQSACQSPLELHLSTSLPSMLCLYTENRAQDLAAAPSARSDAQLEQAATARAEYLDLAFPRKSVSMAALRPPAGDVISGQPAERREEQLLSLSELEEGLGLLLDSPIPIAQEQEDAAVTRTYTVLRDLQRYLAQGRLAPLKKLTLAPGAQVVICAVLTATKEVYRLSGKLQQLEARITISLTQPDSEPPVRISREVVATAKVCQSMMSLAQKNFNFGSVDKKEAHTPTLVINNLSQVPIVYRITKSKTLSSYDLVVNSRSLGVIRPYRSKEVEFLFKPSMSGPFSERLTIHNVHDPANSQPVLVKANVVRSLVLFIEAHSLTL